MSARDAAIISRSSWLDRRLTLGFAKFLLAAEIGFFIFFGLGTAGLIVPLKKPISTDFVSFYAAGSLANAGSPQLAYDQVAHYAAEENASRPGIAYNYFYYPPPFLLLCSALARLPYLAAFIAFESLSLALYVLIVRRILAERGWEIVVGRMRRPYPATCSRPVPRHA